MSFSAHLFSALTGRLKRWNDLNEEAVTFYLRASKLFGGRSTEQAIATARIALHLLICPSLGKKRVLQWDVKTISPDQWLQIYSCILAVVIHVESLPGRGHSAPELGFWFHAAAAGQPLAQSLLSQLKAGEKFDLFIVSRRLNDSLQQARGSEALDDLPTIYRLAVTLGSVLKSVGGPA